MSSGGIHNIVRFRCMKLCAGRPDNMHSRHRQHTHDPNRTTTSCGLTKVPYTFPSRSKVQNMENQAHVAECGQDSLTARLPPRCNKLDSSRGGLGAAHKRVAWTQNWWCLSRLLVACRYNCLHWDTVTAPTTLASLDVHVSVESNCLCWLFASPNNVGRRRYVPHRPLITGSCASRSNPLTSH